MKSYFFNEAKLLYLGDTANKTLKVEYETLNKLCVSLTQYNKLPDIIFYEEKKNLLFLIEAVTSNGPVSPKRQK
jgi:type II restriction enzyme